MVNMLLLEKRAKLKRAIAEKIPTRHAAVIFHYDNARQEWLKTIWKTAVEKFCLTPLLSFCN